MIEGVMFICYLVIAEPERPETCIDVPSPNKFDTIEQCESTAESVKFQFRQVANMRGHKLTKLFAECSVIEEEKPGVEI